MKAGRNRRCALWCAMGLCVVLLLEGSAFGAVLNLRTAKKEKGFRIVLDMNAAASFRADRDDTLLQMEVDTPCLNPKNGTLPFPGKAYRLVNRGNRCTLFVDLMQSNVTFKTFTMKGPHRIVLDVLPRVAGVAKSTPASQPEVQVQAAPTGVPQKSLPAVPPSVDREAFLKLHGLTPLRKGSSGQVRSLNIRMTPRDLPMRQLLSSRIFYFDVAPSWKPVEGSYIELVLSHSELLNPLVSNVTVAVNGIPMRTIPLDEQNLWKGYVSIPLDPKILRPGTNEVELTALVRIHEERCSDIDSPANWYRLHRESLVHLRYLPRSELRLRDFPSPYFASNQYRVDNTLLVVPDRAEPEEISAAYELLLRWSLLAPGKDIRAEIRHVSEVTASQASTMHCIYLGRESAFPEVLSEAFGVPGGLTGSVFMKTFVNSRQLGRMCIIGRAPEDVLFGVRGLLSPEIRNQMETSEVLLSLKTPLPKEPSHPLLGTDITLEKLFMPDMVMRGISLHHQEAFSFRIPPQWEVYGNPKLVLLFRHSTNLDNVKSTIEVDINDIPQRGISLTEENAENGRLAVPLRHDMVTRDYINVGVRGYLDISVPDCSRFYTESAWMVVDKKSYFHLPHKTRQLEPLLENLPYAFIEPDLRLYIPRSVGGAALSALGKVLLDWQAKMFFPLHVDVADLLPDFSRRPGENAVILAPMEELVQRNLPLSVRYDSREKALVSGPRVPVVQPFGREAVLFQILSRKKDVTLVLSWGDRMPQGAFLAKTLLGGKLRGDTCLVSPGGEAVPFYLKSGDPSLKEEEKSPFSWYGFWEFLRGSRQSLGLFAFGVLLVGALLVFSLFRSLRRR